MQKVVHEYKNVQVPLEAKELVDQIYQRAKAINPRIRKADVWLSAVRHITVNKVIKGE